MIKISLPRWLFGAVLSLMWLFLACTQADVVGGLAGLRKQIAAPDPQVIKLLMDSSQAQSFLAELQPGASFYLGRSLQQHGMIQEAARLFRHQIEVPAMAWQGPAFRAWLVCLQSLKSWDQITQESPAILISLRKVFQTSQSDPIAAIRESRECLESWQRAMLESMIQLRQTKMAEVFLKEAAQDYSTDEMPAWMALAQGRLGLQILSQNPSEITHEVFDSLLPALLSVDAQDGHTDLAWQLSSLISGSKLDAEAANDCLLRLIRAKDLLSRGQARLAFSQFREFLVPKGKVKSAPFASAKRLQRGLSLVLENYQGLPDSLFRDIYNAARLAGQLSDGISALDQFRTQIIAANPKLERSALPAMVSEFVGRLLRAKGDHRAARAEFSRSLALAEKLEAKGRFAIGDRQRIQWYQLRSWTDEAEASGKLDVAGFIRDARACDDPDYFEDVLEKAILLVGKSNHWADFERIFRNLAGNLSVNLKSRCNLVLARLSQLKANQSAAERSRFEQYSLALRDQSESLYYRAMALWLRGESLDIQSLLQSQAGNESYDTVESERSINLPWAVAVTQGFCSMGLYDAGLEYLWKLRKEISVSQLVALGQLYLQAERPRSALRIFESVRVRFGHPGDHKLLESFYPRLYLDGLHAAVDGSTVPEWLMFALVRTESNFDSNANSGAGAQGLSQLMPATANLMAKKLGLTNPDLSDPAVNLLLGAGYLRDQYRHFGLWPQTLAAYNAGMGRVRSWTKDGLHADPVLFAELIPIDESRNYVRRITEASLIYNWLYYDLEPSVVLSLIFQAN